MYKDAQIKLRTWYLKNMRELSFRKTKDPYKIWISEVMLQQTRINYMLPKYEKFIEKFPTILSLYKSNESEVIQAWQGLGYYSRAINLKKAAKFLFENYNSEFPKQLEDVLKIPGIGQYTARAVLSISFNLPLAVLDGNVKRVLSRFFLFEENINTSSSHKKLQELADNFLYNEFPSDHNQAMMELGATICTLNPNCEICPINKFCKAKLHSKEKLLPITIKEKKNQELELLFFIFESREKILLIRDSERRFFKKIFTLPFLIKGKNLSKEYESKNEFYKIMSKIESDTEAIQFGTHSITHHKIKLYYTKALNQNLSFSKNLEYKWINKEKLIQEFPSSIAEKLNKVVKYVQ